LRGGDHGCRGRRPSGPGCAHRAALRRRGRGRAPREVRLDRCGPFLGARRARRQLRTGRPASGASRRGARPARADRRRRTRIESVAHRILTRAVRRWAAIPVPGRIAVVYLLSRLITTGFLLIATGVSSPASRFGSSPSLRAFVLGWDAQWYWWVSVNGYPSVLPLADGGGVAENAWAFMPVYAYLSGWVGAGDWGAGALAVSLTAGYLGCLVLHRMLRPRIGASAAMWAVTFFSCGPLAALFQVGYAEALFTLLLLIALSLVMRRRYVWLYAVLPVLGFTRPGILA